MDHQALLDAARCKSGQLARATSHLTNLIGPTDQPHPSTPHQANYGLKDPAAVARVKAVYAELGMAKRFEDYEAESYARLSGLIKEQKLLPEGVFTNLLGKIYKRQK